jgi:hypothetical protein
MKSWVDVVKKRFFFWILDVYLSALGIAGGALGELRGQIFWRWSYR